MAKGFRISSIEQAQGMLGKRAFESVKEQLQKQPQSRIPSAEQLSDPVKTKKSSVKRDGKTSSRTDHEGDEQVLLVEAFNLTFSAYSGLLIHIPNGGKRNKFEAWRLKQQGVRAGVSDLLLPVARKGFHGLWIEFKASPPNTSPVTDLQLEWLEAMKSQGYKAELCEGKDAAMKVLEEYLG